MKNMMKKLCAWISNVNSFYNCVIMDLSWKIKIGTVILQFIGWCWQGLVWLIWREWCIFVFWIVFALFCCSGVCLFCVSLLLLHIVVFWFVGHKLKLRVSFVVCSLLCCWRVPFLVESWLANHQTNCSAKCTTCFASLGMMVGKSAKTNAKKCMKCLWQIVAILFLPTEPGQQKSCECLERCPDASCSHIVLWNATKERKKWVGLCSGEIKMQEMVKSQLSNGTWTTKRMQKRHKYQEQKRWAWTGSHFWESMIRLVTSKLAIYSHSKQNKAKQNKTKASQSHLSFPDASRWAAGIKPVGNRCNNTKSHWTEGWPAKLDGCVVPGYCQMSKEHCFLWSMGIDLTLRASNTPNVETNVHAQLSLLVVSVACHQTGSTLEKVWLLLMNPHPNTKQTHQKPLECWQNRPMVRELRSMKVLFTTPTTTCCACDIHNGLHSLLWKTWGKRRHWSSSRFFNIASGLPNSKCSLSFMIWCLVVVVSLSG